MSISSPQPLANGAWRIAPSRRYGPKALEYAAIVPQWWDAATGPGETVNLLNSTTLTALRKQKAAPTPYTGVHPTAHGPWTVQNVKNPDRADGKWDPFAYMPRFVFSPREDAYPVDPSFDGDGSLADNAPQVANGPGGHYQDGVVGGKQPLDGAFVVTKKAGYTVLTYAFYYAHNKGGEYHPSDYSTVQVYLKPGKDGKLAPAYLYAAWHRGGILCRYDELKKDAQGRPIVAICRGTHAVQPVGKHAKTPTTGLQIRGDGQAEYAGKPLPLTLRFDAFQSNVLGARVLNTTDPLNKPRLATIQWGETELNPLLPAMFGSPWKELEQRAWGFVQRGWQAIEGWFSHGSASAPRVSAARYPD